MIDGLDHADRELFASHVTVPADSPYVVGGVLCPEMLLEVMAQCFAAGMGHLAALEGREASGAGYLAAVSEFRTGPAARAGDRLEAECRVEAVVGRVWVAAARVTRDGAPMAEGRFKIYIP
ncbi:MAG: hypothetical protein Q4F72_05445 [Desulfovibrionaceae bacterium]|nr:hypothetical protein [Desulfovibrionaceae bacterium]